MSTITKEQAQSVSDLKAGYTLGNADVAIMNELARIALASLEAEPVAWRHFQETPTDGGYWILNDYKPKCSGVEPLFTAPPAPVSVPDEKVKGDDFELNGPLSCYQAGKIDGWNEYRAAMLQGAEPSKMSGIMPDYEGCVMTQRECFQAGWEAHHAAMLRADAPVQFGWSKGHFGYHTLFNAIGKAVNIQGNALSISVSAFEDAMLAAAPQQEVK